MKKSYIYIVLILFSLGFTACGEGDFSSQSYNPEAMSKPAHLETIMPGSPENSASTGGSTANQPPRNPSLELERLFEDDFSDSSSGWDVEYYETGSTDYLAGTYRILINKGSQYIWGNPYRDFGDVIVEVETTKVSGEDDDYLGVICRHYDVDNYYALTISSDGFAIIRQRTSDGLDNLIDYIYTDVINQGINGTNLVRAECVGDRLTLFVNGEFIAEAYDPDIATGDVGLIAGTISAPSSEISFDNFIVYQPEP